MPQFGLGMGYRMAKRSFFDSERIMRRVDAATRRSLSRFGAYCRTNARDRLRRRKKWSDPGESPSVHHDLMRAVFFAYEPEHEGVVIGPVIARPSRRRRGITTIPELLEHGGASRRKVTEWWLRMLRKAAKHTPRAAEIADALADRVGETVTTHYEPRPFMGPAFEETKEELPDIWHDSVRP